MLINIFNHVSVLGLAGDVHADKWNKLEQPPKNKSTLGMYIYYTRYGYPEEF